LELEILLLSYTIKVTNKNEGKRIDLSLQVSCFPHEIA
jgi:hypothetical protein